jgi:hypothetical protein
MEVKHLTIHQNIIYAQVKILLTWRLAVHHENDYWRFEDNSKCSPTIQLELDSL